MDIAMARRFNDLSHIGKSFRMEFGASPWSTRKLARSVDKNGMTAQRNLRSYEAR